MHIAFISPFLGQSGTKTPPDGVATYAQCLVRALLNQGREISVEIFATFHHGNRSARKQERIILEKTDSRTMVTIESGFSPGVRGFIEILGIIWKRKYDIIHLQHETYLFGNNWALFAFPLFVLLLRMSGKPVITLHHVVAQREINADFSKTHFTRMPSVLIRIGYQLFFRSIGKTAKLLIVHHERFKTILEQDYGVLRSRIAVVPHGIDESVPLASQPKQELLRRFKISESIHTVFGFLGFATGYKGLDVLIREFALHAREMKGTALLICAGEHPRDRFSPGYQQTIQEMKRAVSDIPEGRAIWHGFLANENMADFFEAIDCLVLPYRSSVSASGILAHAIAYEKPIIVSNFLQDFTQGAIVTSLQPQYLAKALTAFSGSTSDERDTLRAALRKTKETESWNIVGTRTLSLYNNLLPKHDASILLIGAYGQQNLGDELLLDQCLHLLPRSQCIVVSADPERTKQEHGVNTIPRKGHFWTLLHSIWHSRSIVIGGGDQFKLLKPSTGRSRYSLLLLCAFLTLVARVLGKHVYYVGVGIGNIGTRLAAAFTKWSLNRIDSVVFRDERSFCLARELAPRAKIFRGTDLAFLSTEHTRPAKNTVNPSHVGIAPCAQLDKALEYTSVIQQLARGIDNFVENFTIQKATFLPFQTGFAEHNDIVVSREIMAKVQHAEVCAIEEQLNLSSVHQIYSSLDVLWGMRLHSLILACLYQVPFIALIYNVKVRKFLEEIDCVQWGIALDDSFTAEKLIALHNRLLQNIPDVRRHLKVQTTRLQNKAQIDANLLSAIAVDHSLQKPAQSAPPSAEQPLSAIFSSEMQ